ncbi:hypothetical protein EVG20_g6388, partial [Dentipellis fragilis]
LLWPVGQISVNGINSVSQLLHSAINGAKSAGSPKILIHLANGWNWSGLSSFFKSVFIPGALSTSDIDIIGVSFYPFYDAGATLSALKSSLTNLANTYGKPIVVAETDWPVSCSGVQLTEPSIPVSTSGQETWITDIKNVLTSLPNGLGQGSTGNLVGSAALTWALLAQYVDLAYLFRCATEAEVNAVLIGQSAGDVVRRYQDVYQHIPGHAMMSPAQVRRDEEKYTAVHAVQSTFDIETLFRLDDIHGAVWSKTAREGKYTIDV